MKHAIAVLVLLCAGVVSAKGPASAVLRHKPGVEGPEERPVATDVAVTTRDGAFVLKLQFDKAPFGDACRNRCANATIYLDTDNLRDTGLQVARGAATGADLAVTVQGVRDWDEAGAKDRLRVRIRHLPGTPSSLEEGDVIAELDHARDEESVTVKENTVTVSVDPNVVDLPAGKTARVIYQPPGSKALTGTLPGLLAPPTRGGGKRNIDVMRGGQSR